MDNQQALRVINLLADGIDPHTGEVLPESSPYQHPDTVRALYKAVKALEQQQRTSEKRRSLPENAGNPWPPEEEQVLLSDFDSGVSVKELAKKHQRTEGAIRSRLEKLGKSI